MGDLCMDKRLHGTRKTPMRAVNLNEIADASCVNPRKTYL
jgi:hypothetical protein